MVVSRLDKCRILFRSCALQLFLNYKTMQGAGYANALGPILKRSSARKADVAKAASFINGHPVFSSIALGAIAKRLKEEPELSREKMAAWKRELSTPLGAIGDSLIWEKFKPLLLVLGAATLLCLRHAEPVIWVIALAVMWGLYNFSLFLFRRWGFDRGSELGAKVLELSLHPGLTTLRKTLRVFSVLASALLFSVAITTVDPSIAHWIPFAAGFLIMLFARKLRIGTFTAVFLALMAGLLLHNFIPTS